MEKYYVLQQVNATGNGSTTTTLLVTNPRVENGAIFATKVGIIDSNRSGLFLMNLFSNLWMNMISSAWGMQHLKKSMNPLGNW